MDELSGRGPLRFGVRLSLMGSWRGEVETLSPIPRQLVIPPGLAVCRLLRWVRFGVDLAGNEKAVEAIHPNLCRSSHGSHRRMDCGSIGARVG